MITELSSRIWLKNEFQKDYAALLVAARQKEWKMLTLAEEPFEQARLDRLIQSATHFAGSNLVEHHRAGYRIAIAAWFLLGEAEKPLEHIVAFILGRLGNLPALDFFHDQNHSLGRSVSLPLPLSLEFVAREKRNTVQLRASGSLRLTDFQTDLWAALQSGNTVVVNAPTSAGKSFALQNYLMEMMHARRADICVYLVPSRALITQVADSFRQLLSQQPMDDVITATIPQTPEELGVERVMYVLTQERLQMLMDRLPAFKADFIVVDEAQMVADDARGIVLQTAVERLRRNNNHAPLLFGSPTASNPEVFARLFAVANPRILKVEESPVAQDLIVVHLDGNEPTLGTVHLRIGSKSHLVGSILFDSVLVKPEHILTHVARHFGRGQQSLIYVGSADRCETVATMLLELERQSPAFLAPNESQLSERKEFAQFLRAYFHKDYELASAVEYGIAFHYSGMPSTIRQALEGLFSTGALHTLICTATLLHGVNLPARNVFLFDPTKGGAAWSSNSKSLSSSEFWNLAGRAGRLKKEFTGNIFLIAPDRWRERAYEGNPLHAVKPALAEQLTTHRSSLVEFIADRDRASGKDEALENAFMRLVNDMRRNRITDTLRFLDLEEIQEVQEHIMPALDAACAGLTVPLEVAEANPNVSIYRQQEMLDYFRMAIANSGHEDLIPRHPMQPRAWDGLSLLIQRVHLIFLKMNNRMHEYTATVAIQWMQGRSYEQFISYQWEKKKADYEKKKRAKTKGLRTPDLSSVIRNVFGEIENKLRFTYVKFTKCYLDLLRCALIEVGRTDVAERLVPLPLYLELGASSVTMVNLIGLGLSRVCAAILSDQAPSANMTRLELLSWLRRTDFATRGVSPIVLRELAPLIAQ